MSLWVMVGFGWVNTLIMLTTAQGLWANIEKEQSGLPGGKLLDVFLA